MERLGFQANEEELMGRERQWALINYSKFISYNLSLVWA